MKTQAQRDYEARLRRERREAAARREPFWDRFNVVLAQARSGDQRAQRVMRMLEKPSVDSERVLDAYENGKPLQQYISSAEREYWQREKLHEHGEWQARRAGRYSESIYDKFWPAEGGSDLLQAECAYAGCLRTYLTKTRRQKFCSERCARANKVAAAHAQRERFEAATLECAADGCNERIFRLRPDHRFCSARCRGRGNRKSREELLQRACDGCGEWFTPKTIRARFCEDRCRVRAWSRKQADTNADTRRIAIVANNCSYANEHAEPR